MKGGFLRSGKLDREQLQRLYEQHSRGLLAYACTFLPSFSSAEDVLHQVFERVLRRDVEIDTSPVSYLYRAVRNAALNDIRDRSREVEIDDSWLEAPAGMQQAGFELQSALRDLPEEQREIVMLRIWGKLTFEEAGAVIGVSANTAASRYRYGISKLREQFKIATKG